VVRFEDDAANASSAYEGMQPLTGKDVADIVYWTTQVPPYINVNQLEVMPLAQVWYFFLRCIGIAEGAAWGRLFRQRETPHVWRYTGVHPI